MTDIAVGVAWYSRATWVALKAHAPDADELEATYEDWLIVFHDGFTKVRAAGVNPQRIEVDFAAFTEWCSEEGRPLDSAARADFTSELVRRAHDPSSSSDA